MVIAFHKLSARSKIGLIALSAAAIAVGGVLLVLGITLFVGVSVLGVAVALGAGIYQKLTGRSLFRIGRRPAPMEASREVFPPAGDEVFPEQRKFPK